MLKTNTIIIVVTFLIFSISMISSENLKDNENYSEKIKSFFSSFFGSDQAEENKSTTPPKFEEIISLITKHKYKKLNLSELKERTSPLVIPSMSTIEVAQLPNYRTPNDIVCVIDTSRSMSGAKINLVKESLMNLVDYLTENDRLSLISFDEDASIRFPLQPMTEQNKESVRMGIPRMWADGGTNIRSGLNLAYDVLKGRKYFNENTSIIVLSDGEDNDPEELKNYLDSLTKEQNYNPSVIINTYGYGHDHDSEIMTEIAIMGRGKYYYVDDITNVDETLMHCLGGLLSVVVKDVKLRISLKNNIQGGKVSISKLYGLENSWKEEKNEKGQIEAFYTIIPSLIYGKKLNFVYEISLENLPDQKINDDVTDLFLINAELIIPDGPTIIHKEISINNVTSESLLNLLLDRDNTDTYANANHFRVRGSDVFHRTQILSNMGYFEQSQKVAKEFNDEVQEELKHNKEEEVVELAKDLKKYEEINNEEKYKSDGQHYALSVYYSAATESSERVSNAKQKEMISESRKRKQKKKGEDF